MNVVILSPHFPGNHYHFCANLHNLGAMVLGIGDEKYEKLHNDLKSVLTEYYRVNDMQDYDQLVRAMGYFTHKYGKVDCLESHSDYWLETDAKLRTDFNIYGIKEEDINQITRKSLMKKKFVKAGVAVAPGKVVHKLKDATNYIKKIGFPVVVKSDIGQNAMGTYKINDQQELITYIESNLSAEYFIEKFISGQKYTFDGLVDHAGQLVFYTSHVFSPGFIEAANDENDTYYYSLRDIPKNLEEAGMNALKVFDIKERFFHFEFIITPEGQAVAIDVHMCSLGGLTMEMFNFANDADFYNEWSKIVMNGTTTIDYSRKYHCAYIERNATKDYAHTQAEIMEKFGQCIVKNELDSGKFNAAPANYGYLARSESLQDIQEIINFIQG